ncbi:hypothetical protein GCM10023196_102280 [Actinoallomurus vinaceus]|uniref:CBM2 domain-containing protein n=1 Tax=Actinoallomurus vinaceus TaxID=1080074 RepID=A0ABP8UTM5_9ACTN
MATGMAGERDDRDVPAHLRVTDEIPVGTPWRPEDTPPATRSPEATASPGAPPSSEAMPSADADTPATAGSATTADSPTEAGAYSPADTPAEAGASASAGRPTVTGASLPTGVPTPTDAPSAEVDVPNEMEAPVDRTAAAGESTPADPPPGPFLEADSPSVAGPATAGAPGEARTARPVPATDVQVVPPPEPPRPYVPPVTVEEGIPMPPGGPYRPVASPAAGRRPLTRALRVGVILAGAVLMGVGFLLVFGVFAGGAKHPAPCGGKPCAPRPSGQAAPPGAQIAYRTVERDRGYFEGTVTIANHGDQPMRSWTLSFRYPGAQIHNTWDAVLQRKGEDAILTGTATARPIAPGATLEVRFGGSGSPSMPTDCRLNGAPCAFVAR